MSPAVLLSVVWLDSDNSFRPVLYGTFLLFYAGFVIPI